MYVCYISEQRIRSLDIKVDFMFLYVCMLPGKPANIQSNFKEILTFCLKL